MATEPCSEAVRRQFEVERELADRLRAATKEERRRLYGTVYEELFRRLPEQPQLTQKQDPAARAELVRLQTALLEPFFPGVRTFLEIGSGDGSLVQSLAARIERVVAVEASETIASGAAAPPNLQVLPAAGERIDLPDGAIDLAFSSHFVEHLHPDDLPDHLAEVRRLLRPGAAYVCVTPNRLYGPHDVSRYFTDEPRGLHLAEYTHASLAGVFRDAGFRRVRVLRGIGRPPAVWRLAPYALLEICLGLLPAAARRRLGTALPGGDAPPFRALEQVKLVATR